MTTGDFDAYYGDTPVSALDQNQRDWYHPILDSIFRQQSVFTGLVRFYKNLGAVNAKNMTITQILDVHGDFDPLGLRDIWMPASHVDSRNTQVTFSRYGGKVAYHEYDDIITYWKANQAGGWKSILQGQLGHHMVTVHDYLTRNAFFNLPFSMIAGGGSDFSDVATTDLMTLDIADEIWLGFGYRDVPMAMDPSLSVSNGQSILCVTSPGVVYDLRQGITENADFIPIVKYQPGTRIMNYEIGQFRGVRYISTPRATLWNCGTQTAQFEIDAPVTAGDGAPDPETTTVDDTYYTGQKGMTHYIQFATADMSGLSAGQIVTLHITRTSANGISDGVDFGDGKLHNRRLVAVDDTNNRVVLDKPIMVDMTTDLGSGVYGYMTLGRHVHASLFVGGPDAIVGGVGRPPVVKAPPPVDDFEQIFRFSWNGYEGFQSYRPEVAEVVFSGGSVRIKGPKVNQ
jgi:N4-gp56 family major capsid protein